MEDTIIHSAWMGSQWKESLGIFDGVKLFEMICEVWLAFVQLEEGRLYGLDEQHELKEGMDSRSQV